MRDNHCRKISLKALLLQIFEIKTIGNSLVFDWEIENCFSTLRVARNHQMIGITL